MTRLEEIETRKAEIREEVASTEEIEKVEELNEEVEALDEEVKQIEEQKEVQEQAEELEEKSFKAQEIVKEERKTMNKEELRNSKEYVDAYAEYIKTGSDKELRTLFTTNATETTGSVEVPEIVEDIVRTAWEREDLMSRVRTLAVKGNLKVQFEVSGGEASIHQEGNSAVSEESLVLGVVTLTPKSIKKWISISDEVVDLRGEAFLRYIYDELTYRIAKKCADELIAIIKQLPSSLSANADTGVYDTVSANAVSTAPAVDTIAKAIANLSDEAREYTIVMNKLTYANFKAVQYANGYGVDVFEGIDVVFNNSLPAYDTASANAVYCIVGDFRHGAMATYPNGNDTFIYMFESVEGLEQLEIIASKGNYQLENVKCYVLSREYVHHGDVIMPEVLESGKAVRAANVYEGSITMEQSGYFVTSFPYRDGYRMMVDDKEVETEIVNTTFIGCAMEPGTHQVQIYFEAPGYKLGLIVSLLAFTVFGMMILIPVVWKRKR